MRLPRARFKKTDAMRTSANRAGETLVTRYASRRNGPLSSCPVAGNLGGIFGSDALTAEPYHRGLFCESPEMPQAASRDPIYRRRRFSAELIEQRIRWYLTYRLSYRDLSAMMAEREITVS